MYWSPAGVAASWRTRTVGWCSSCCTTRCTAWATSARCSSVRSGRRLEQSAQLGRDNLVRTGSQRGHRRRHVCAAQPSQAGRPPHRPRSPPRPPGRRPMARPGSPRSRVARSTSTTPGRSATSGATSRGTARSKITSGRSARPAIAAATTSAVSTGCDEAVAQTTRSTVGEVIDQRGELHGLGAVSLGGAGGPGRIPVGHGQRPGTSAGKGRQRERAHRPGSDHERRPARDSVRSQGECGADDALTGLVDAGLRVHALANPQRLLHQLMQQAASGVPLARRLVRLAELTQDLGLANHHRVEASRNPERMPRRIGVEVHVQVAREHADVDPGPLGEHRADVGQAAVERGHRGVHLDAVTGGQDDSFGHIRGAHEAGQELRGLVPRDGQSLQQLNRGGVVGHADDKQVHRGTTPSAKPRAAGRAPLGFTVAPLAQPAAEAFRRSWKLRI